MGVVFCLNIESIRGLMESFTGTELFSAEIYFLSKLPAEIDWIEVAYVVAMALFLNLYSLDISSLASFQNRAGGGT